MDITQARQKLEEILEQGAFTKVVFSKPCDPEEKRMTLSLVTKADEVVYQCERLLRDGKALHENLTREEALVTLPARMGVSYRQVDGVTPAGNITFLFSKKGSVTLLDNRKKSAGAEAAAPAAHDRVKRHLLDHPQAVRFLYPLGIADKDGRILDRMRPKYRQINRFLELLSDVYDKLPAEGPLVVYDLCCGKSYLTFAVYFYLTVLRDRQVEMFGVDRKADVMAYCTEVARTAGFEGLSFQAGDIEVCLPPKAPHLVVSLHACDIATDLVLRCAVQRGAGVILSTPCCHHEMFHTMHTDKVPFLGEHSILKQKLADAATDALRCTWLQAKGYQTEAIELVDPEETPKNVMIRAVRIPHPNRKTLERKKEEYRAGCAFFGVEPFLYPYLEDISQS